MKKIFCTVIVVGFIIYSSLLKAENQSLTKIENDGSILLPAQKSSEINLTTDIITNDKKWANFQKQNPSWKIFFNKITHKPHRAFGKPIQIEGFTSIETENVKEAAIGFLNNHNDIFGLNANDLKLRKSIKINKLWSLSFAQLYNGIEVLLTEVELRIRQDGKVVAFGINTYDNINLETVPAISQSQAEKIAANGLQFDDKKDKVQSNGMLYVLPVKFGNSVDFGLVKEIMVDMPSTNQKFASYVDMHKGNILWRRNLIANVETPVTVKGGVKLESRLSPITEEYFGNFKFSVGSTNYSTDESGSVNIDVSQASTVSALMEGNWTKITYDSQKNASFTGSINPGEPFTLQWDDNNSNRFERDLYYYTNHAHWFYKMMDTSSKAMDFQLSVTIYNYGQPNAASDLENGDIYFLGANQSGLYVVETPSVLYHEYGHSINTRLYKELGIQQGMINAACHEAMADLNGGLMTDQPKIGYLAFSDTTRSIRNLVNTRKYPRDINEESHNDGMILGGAFWDLRKITNLDYVRWLVHYTKKMGTPDDENTGMAFFEWFIEALITDDSQGDGDNDMSNGTPFATEIIESFNKHDIGTKLAMMLSFEHTPYEDTQDTENPYKIQFKVRNPITFLNYEPQNVNLHYSIDGLKTKTEIPATSLGDDTYEAFIPAMPKGTIIKYYMSALDQQSGQNIYFSLDNIDFKAFEFLVGFKVGFTDNIENSVGWTFGDSGDDATGGKWELGIPQQIAFNFGTDSEIIQPGSDHSESGTKCLVTGASNGGGTQQGIFANMPNGKTTVISPTFDLSGTEKPIFRYYRFISNLPYIGGNPATFKTLVSSNDGVDWVDVETTSTPTAGWEKAYFMIESYVDKSDRFKVKFEFTGYFWSGIPFYFAEGLVDDIEILTINDDANITGKTEEDINPIINIYPNPFKNYVEIKINNLYEFSNLRIFDIFGNTIKEISSDDGSSFRWDATDIHGQKVNCGVYFIKITINNKTYFEKIILQ